MKKLNFTLILLLVVSLFSILLSSCSKNEATPNAGKNLKAERTLAVRYMVVSTASVEDDLTLTGSLLSNEEVEIRSEITGKVISINFKEGSKVKNGALLIKINDDELQAQKKKLSLKQKLASDNENRQRKLLESNGTSKETYDIAYNELQVINADIELVDAQLRKTEIRAPFDGTIGLRYISNGAYITPATKIAYLQSINPIKTEFSIPQKYSGFFNANKSIKLTSQSGKTYTGRLFATESKLDAASRSLLVRAVINNNDNNLKPGEFVSVNLPVSNKTEVVLIPSMAVVPDIKGETVYLYKSGKAVQTVVKIGLRNSEEVEIVNGINKGDTLIVSGIIQLRNRMNVSLKND